MLKILVELGPLKIYSYGFMLMVAFAVGILIAVRRGRRYGIPPDWVLDLSTLIVFAAIGGARLLYVLYHREAYDPHWWGVFKVWEGGLTVYGGAAAAVAVSIWFCRRRRIPFLRMADAMAPSLALGVGITRIGCFLNGCCFGEECSVPWAVRFPEHSYAYYAHGGNVAGVHPAQLYASVVGLAVFLILLRMARTVRKQGELFWWFLLLFAGGTFFTDFARYWEESALILKSGGIAVSLNQLLELGLAVVAGLFLRFGSGRGERMRVGASEGLDG